jgi:putative transposase
VTECCNPAGTMIAEWWICLPSKFVDIELDLCVVMPNHFHGIVVINRHPNAPYRTVLSEAIQWFKVMTTNAYIQGVKSDNWAAFDGKLWQRSFHDHIIRSERELNLIRQYVESNPAKWAEDTFYE